MKKVYFLSIFLMLSLIFSGCTQKAPSTAVAVVDSTKAIPVENSEFPLTTLTNAHYHIHIGKFWTVAHSINLGIGDTYYVTLEPREHDTDPHFVFELKSDLAAHVSIYENATLNTNGTLEPTYNRNRNFGDVNKMDIYVNSTFVDLGKKIYEQDIGSKRLSGTARTDNEWILNRNYTYVIELRSEANDNRLSYTFNWYND